MVISSRDDGEVTVLDLSGRFTLTEGSGRLKDKVASLVFEGRKQIVLDLAHLAYMDSAALGEMVACYSSATRNGAQVKLANTTGKIKDLLTITKLLTVFDSYDSTAEAAASFRSS